MALRLWSQLIKSLNLCRGEHVGEVSLIECFKAYWAFNCVLRAAIYTQIRTHTHTQTYNTYTYNIYTDVKADIGPKASLEKERKGLACQCQIVALTAPESVLPGYICSTYVYVCLYMYVCVCVFVCVGGGNA